MKRKKERPLNKIGRLYKKIILPSETKSQKEFQKELLMEMYQKANETSLEHRNKVLTLEKQAVSFGLLCPNDIIPMSKKEFREIRSIIMKLEKQGIIKSCDAYIGRLDKEGSASRVGEVTVIVDLSFLPSKILKLMKSTWVELETEDGSTFKFNIETGEFQFGKKTDSFTPETKISKFIKALIKNPNHKLTYNELAKELWPEKDFDSEKECDYYHRRQLQFVLRNCKNKLGLLPKKDSEKSDIFENIEGWGYRLKIK